MKENMDIALESDNIQILYSIKKWGSQSTTFPEQGDRDNFSTCLFFSNTTVSGVTYSGHRNFLENYNPNRTEDPNRWLPKGLMNDLMDGGIEPAQSRILNDNVSGYTNAQFYNALTNDVRGMNSYRDKLLQQNNNNQVNDVNILFQQYGY